MTPPLITQSAEAPSGWREIALRRGTFYHDDRWISGIANCFGFQVHWVTVRSDRALVGAMALAEVPSLLRGKRLVSFPFSYAAGPAADDDLAVPRLIEASRELAAARRIPLVEIKRVGDTHPPPTGFSRSTRYSTYRIPVAVREADLWGQLNADSTRRGIRRAERAGVDVSVQRSVEGWRVMAALQDRTARRHGIPAPPRRFFTHLCVQLQAAGLADLYVAHLRDGRAAAGVVIWKGGREWIYAFGASDPASLRDRPNHLLLWTVLRESVKAEVTVDLGRAAPEQEGLIEFKRRWGGQPIPLAYDYWPHVGGPNAVRRDRGPLALASRVWSRLPLPLSRLGSRFYRYLG